MQSRLLPLESAVTTAAAPVPRTAPGPTAPRPATAAPPAAGRGPLAGAVAGPLAGSPSGAAPDGRGGGEEPGDRPRRLVGPAAGRLPAAHDLLLMQCPGSLRPLDGGPVPDWARTVLRAHPWVTVARAHTRTGTRPPQLPHPVHCPRDPDAAAGHWIPVTVRGPHPGQRLDALAPLAAVARTLRPEQLPARLALLPPERVATVPALAAVARAGRLAADHRMVWGPVGAVGYELATGAPVTAPDGPLRLVLRTPQPVSRRDALLLRRALDKLPGTVVEAELETRYGTVRLADWAGGAPGLVLRTADGPREVHDPWFPRGPRGPLFPGPGR